MAVIFTFLSSQPVLLLFLLVGLGAALGRIRIAGVSLGAIAVLFAALGLTAWSVALGVDLAIPAVLGDLGLVLFAYCTGLIAGPGFFAALRTAWPLMLAVTGVLAVSAGVALVTGRWWGIPTETIAGVFAGAVTNTPALAAAGGSPAATVGYASTYAFGVIGAMLVTALALRSRATDTDAPAVLVDKSVRVDTDSAPTVAELIRRSGGRVTISRLRPRGGEGQRAVAEDTPLDAGAIVNVVGPRDAVDGVAAELGHTSTLDITRDRTQVDFRRIILSDARHAGRTIAALHLHTRFGARIVRVRRGDVDLVAADELVLHQGDRLRVVGPVGTIADVTAFLGDSERGLADINPLGLSLVVIGLLAGAVSIPTPWGGTFAIGAAAGALIIGLVLGRIGRIGPVVSSLPHTAASVLAELGLLVFLAFAGTKAGSLIVSAIVSGEILRLLALGLIITVIAMLGTYLVLRHVFRLGGTQLSGAIGGTQTNPAILAFANARTGYDVRVALGYSLVYPAAMVVKIVLAQVLVVL